MHWALLPWNMALCTSPIPTPGSAKVAVWGKHMGSCGVHSYPLAMPTSFNITSVEVKRLAVTILTDRTACSGSHISNSKKMVAHRPSCKTLDDPRFLNQASYHIHAHTDAILYICFVWFLESSLAKEQHRIKVPQSHVAQVSLLPHQANNATACHS